MTWTERKLLELCARRGCLSAPAEDHCLCPQHRDEHRNRNRDYMRQQRLSTLTNH